MSSYRFDERCTLNLSPPNPIMGRDTKLSHFITLSDHENDNHDDYPYYGSKTTRELITRNQPDRLERRSLRSDRHYRHADGDKVMTFERSRVCRPCYDDERGPGERVPRLMLAATFSGPRSVTSQYHYRSDSQVWPGDTFKHKEKWTDVRGETNEVWNSFWGNGGAWKEEGRNKRWSRSEETKVKQRMLFTEF